MMVDPLDFPAGDIMRELEGRKGIFDGIDLSIKDEIRRVIKEILRGYYGEPI